MANPWDSAADEIDSRGAIYDRRLAGRLLRFLAPYRKEVVLSVVLLAAIALLEVAGPFLTKVAIDRFLKPVSGAGVLPWRNPLRPLAACSMRAPPRGDVRNLRRCRGLVRARARLVAEGRMQ